MKKIHISHIGIIFILNLLIKGILIEATLISLLIKHLGILESVGITIIIFSFYGILSIKYYDNISGDVLKINEKGNFRTSDNEQSSVKKLWDLARKWFSGLLLCTQNTGLHVIFHRNKERSFSKGMIAIFLLDIILVSVYINVFVYLGINIYDSIFK